MKKSPSQSAPAPRPSSQSARPRLSPEKTARLLELRHQRAINYLNIIVLADISLVLSILFSGLSMEAKALYSIISLIPAVFLSRAYSDELNAIEREVEKL